MVKSTIELLVKASLWKISGVDGKMGSDGETLEKCSLVFLKLRLKYL